MHMNTGMTEQIRSGIPEGRAQLLSIIPIHPAAAIGSQTDRPLGQGYVPKLNHIYKHKKGCRFTIHQSLKRQP